MTTEEKRIKLLEMYNHPPQGEEAYRAFERALDELANMSDEEVEEHYKLIKEEEEYDPLP